MADAPNLKSLSYPRHVHKANNEYLQVDDAKAADKALKDGWSLTPVLTDEQKAAVKKAEDAAKLANPE